MELLQLTYFCDAALTENFSKTAEKYNVPPSNISQSIKRLEKELSAALFDRRANRVVLNDRGRAFYQQVRQALDLLESAREAAVGHGAEDRLRLVIHVNRRIVMKAVERFQSHCPAVNIFTTHGFSGEQEADLIVSDRVMELPGFSREKLFREAIALAARRDLLPPGDLGADVLRDKPFITMAPGNSVHSLTEAICREMGFAPRIALQSEDPFYIRKCVELGLGLAVVPTFSWKGQFSDQVALYPMGDHSREVYLYRRTGGNTCLEAFCRVLRQEIQAEQA